MTFAREIMAFFCLGVVWVNTSLIVLHTLGDVSTLRALAKKLRPLRFAAFRLKRGTFQPAGENVGPVYRVVQTARRGRDGKLYFHDRRRESLFDAGNVVTDAGVLRLESGSTIWVWPSAQSLAERRRPENLGEFEELFDGAVHATGHERHVEVRFAPGQSVYLAGTLSSDGAALCGTAEQPLLVSADDPHAWLRSTIGRNLAVLLGMVALGAALTWLAFWPPAFGAVSKVGALGLFLYFLLVQPVGVWLSQRSRMPHEAELGGVWTRPASDASGSGSIHSASALAFARGKTK